MELPKERNQESHFLNSKYRNDFSIGTAIIKLTLWSSGISSNSGLQTSRRSWSTWDGRGRNHIIPGKVVDSRQNPTLASDKWPLVSRSLAGIDHFFLNIETANYLAAQQKSSQESYENDMLYGFKRKENQPNKGLNFIDVVNQISEKTKTADRKRSSAYARVEQFNNAFFLDFKFQQGRPKRSTLESVCPRMARNSRSCSVVVTYSSTDSSLISSTNTSNSYSSNSTYNNRQASHLWTNYSNPLFDARPWHPMLESIR